MASMAAERFLAVDVFVSSAVQMFQIVSAPVLAGKTTFIFENSIMDTTCDVDKISKAFVVSNIISHKEKF